MRPCTLKLQPLATPPRKHLLRQQRYSSIAIGYWVTTSEWISLTPRDSLLASQQYATAGRLQHHNMDSLYVHPFIFTTNKLHLIFCLYILFFSNFSIKVHSRTINKTNVKQNSVIMLTIFVKDCFVNYSRLGCFCRYRTTLSFSCLWETVFWLRFEIVLFSVYTQAFSSRRLDLARNVTSPSWHSAPSVGRRRTPGY